MTVHAVAKGGHLRIGLEDNLWSDDDRTDLAPSPWLVGRIVAVGRACGPEQASLADVRVRLGTRTYERSITVAEHEERPTT